MEYNRQCKTTFRVRKLSFWTRGVLNWSLTLKTVSCNLFSCFEIFHPLKFEVFCCWIQIGWGLNLVIMLPFLENNILGKNKNSRSQVFRLCKNIVWVFIRTSSISLLAVNYYQRKSFLLKTNTDKLCQNSPHYCQNINSTYHKEPFKYNVRAPNV